MEGGAHPDLRVSDDERDRIAGLLRDQTVAGRLTLDELSERLELVYAARTRAELEHVTADLPAEAPARSAPKPATRWVVSVMGGVNRKGRWRPGRRLRVVSVMGGAHLDLREALIEAPELSVTCVAVMGGVAIVVPEGVDVDHGGFALMGGNDARVKEPSHPGAPLVRVRGYGLMGGVSVVSKPRG